MDRRSAASCPVVFPFVFLFVLLSISPGFGGSLPGNNIALKKVVTAHSSVQSGHRSFVNDGSIFTLWYSNSSSEPDYACSNCIRFTVDLEAESNIQTIVVYVAQTWRVRISSSMDGNTWVERSARDWGGQYGGATRFDFPGGFQARYLKYEGDADWFQWVGVTEFEVYDDTPIPEPPDFLDQNLALGATAEIFDGGCSAATPPSNALDGSLATTWKPSCKGDDDATKKYLTWGFIQIDLGKIYNLGRLVVKPVHYQFVYFSLSEDPDPGYFGGFDHSFIAFDDLVASGGTSSQEASVYFDNVRARYIRLYASNFQVGENDLVEIAEVEIYEAVDRSSVFMGPVPDQPWTRSIRVDSNQNGRPDEGDETINIIREPASMNYLTFVSKRWGSATVELGNPDAQSGDFSTLIYRRPQLQVAAALGRGSAVPAQESTTTEVTIFNVSQVDETLRPNSVSFERTRVRRGVPSVRTGQGSTNDGGFEFERSGEPRVSLSFVYEDVNSDGNADYASIPWAMAQVLGVNLNDATVDPQIWVPLGDTNGDGIPDSPAFDFDGDGLSDANLPLTPAVSGPALAADAEYGLGFAQFADGTTGPTQFLSEVFLLGLAGDQESLAEVTIRKPDGGLFPLILDGQAFSGSGSFTIPAGGMRLLRTSGQGDLSTGSVRITSDHPLAGVTTYFSAPFGAAGVGASPNLGRGFVAPMSRSLPDQIDIGVAILNLEAEEISLTAELFSTEGVPVAASTPFSLGANGQTARLLGDFQWDLDAGMLAEFDGILKVSSTGLLAATVIQTSSAEYATMPVVSNLNPRSVVPAGVARIAGASSSENEQHRLLFPQFANGSVENAWIRSKIFLFNQEPTGAAAARVLIRGSAGSLLAMEVNGAQTSGEIEVSIPSNGLRILETGGGAGSLVAGSVEVRSDRSISGTLLYTSSFGISGVGNSSLWTQGFLGPMQTDPARSIDTGIAVMNLEESETPLEFSLHGVDGALLATAATTLPAKGQRALLLKDFQWSPALDLTTFTGLVKIDSGGARVAATIIQIRPGQYLTMPVAPRLN